MNQLFKKIIPVSYLPVIFWRSLLRSVNVKSNGRLRVLLFHDIDVNNQGQFENHIRTISKHWKIISPQKFSEIIKSGSEIKGPNVLITFDDGFHSNYVIARSVLEKYGIKALFFIPTDFIGINDRKKQIEYISKKIFNGLMSEDHVPENMRPMSWDNVRSLAKLGHEIGSHTCNHTRLSEIKNDAQLQHELIDSKSKIEGEISKKIFHFAFPFGDINSIDNKSLAVAQKHYEFIFSGIRGGNGPRIPRWALRRDSLDPIDAERYTKCLLDGALDLYYNARGRSLSKMGLSSDSNKF